MGRKTYLAAIVGLGNIGMLYDYEKPEVAWTHRNALHQHPAFKLVGGVDSDPARRQLFQNKFGAAAFADVADLFRDCAPQVVIVSVPTALLSPVVRAVLDKAPKPLKAIVCEKPFALSMDEGEKIVKAAKSCGTALLVNYIRRFEPASLEVRKRVSSGELGALIKGSVFYSKGLFNNASHFIDLMQFWLGNASGFSVIQRGAVTGTDPEPDFLLRFGNGSIAFLAAREENYRIAEAHLFFERGAVRYLKAGREVKVLRVAKSNEFLGQMRLEEREETIPGDFDRYQWHVFDALARHLDLGATLDSTGETALSCLRIVNGIQNLL